jgi:hypothetical protein
MTRALWVVIAAAACGDNPQVRSDALDPVDAIDTMTTDAAVDFTLDTTFGSNGTVKLDVGGVARGASLVLLDNGVVFVSVQRSGTGVPTFAGCRLLGDGTLDPGFNAGTCVQRDWWASPRQAARDGDAILVAANRPLTGPRVYRLLATGSDDAAYGTTGYVNLTPSSGIGSDAVASHASRLADGTHVVAGVGTNLGTNRPNGWTQRVQSGVATPSSGVLVTSTGSVAEILEPTAGLLFVTSSTATRLQCPMTSCGTGYECRYGACVLPPNACVNTLCATGYCETGFNECLPDDVGPDGTSIVRTASDLASITSEVRIGRRIPRRATMLANDELLLLAHAPGMWKVTAAGSLDGSFGNDGHAAEADFVLAAAVLDDGGIAIATGDPAGATGTVLRTLTASGQPTDATNQLAMAAETPITVTDIVMLPAGKLLTVGTKMDSYVTVQRWIVH